MVMTSERTPERVAINLVEAIDQDAPLVEEIRRTARVIAVANRALAAYGVELVTTTEMDEQPPNVETVGMDEASRMIVTARLEELNGLMAVITELVAGFDEQDDQLVVQRFLEYIDARRTTVKRVAGREPESS